MVAVGGGGGDAHEGTLAGGWFGACRNVAAGVPQSVLLGVSYLQSRWDAHDGAPSVTGGYGPMHLADARTAPASAGHHASGSEDPRGDDTRPALRPSRPVALSSTSSADTDRRPRRAASTQAGRPRVHPIEVVDDERRWPAKSPATAVPYRTTTRPVPGSC